MRWLIILHDVEKPVILDDNSLLSMNAVINHCIVFEIGSANAISALPTIEGILLLD